MCDLTNCDENRSGETVAATGKQQSKQQQRQQQRHRSRRHRDSSASGRSAPRFCQAAAAVGTDIRALVRGGFPLPTFLLLLNDRRAAEHAVGAPPQDNVASEADVSEKEEKKREGVHDPENTLSRDKSSFRIPFSHTPPSPLSRFLA